MVACEEKMTRSSGMSVQEEPFCLVDPLCSPHTEDMEELSNSRIIQILIAPMGFRSTTQKVNSFPNTDNIGIFSIHRSWLPGSLSGSAWNLHTGDSSHMMPGTTAVLGRGCGASAYNTGHYGPFFLAPVEHWWPEDPDNFWPPVTVSRKIQYISM